MLLKWWKERLKENVWNKRCERLAKVLPLKARERLQTEHFCMKWQKNWQKKWRDGIFPSGIFCIFIQHSTVSYYVFYIMLSALECLVHEYISLEFILLLIYTFRNKLLEAYINISICYKSYPLVFLLCFYLIGSFSVSLSPTCLFRFFFSFCIFL